MAKLTDASEIALSFFFSDNKNDLYGYLGSTGSLYFLKIIAMCMHVLFEDISGRDSDWFVSARVGDHTHTNQNKINGSTKDHRVRMRIPFARVQRLRQ